MERQVLLLPLLLILFSHLQGSNGCHESEREALLSFKSLLRDPSNRLASWQQGQDCCNWQGVVCSNHSFHVIALKLRNPNPESFIISSNSLLISTSHSANTALEGTISPALFNLSHLRILDLSFNNFMFSKLPNGFSNLTKLTSLSLSNAMFKDSITSQFASMTSLRHLDLSCSYLIADFSPISYNLTLSRIYSSGPTSSYIFNGKISSSSLNWLLGLHNLRELRLDGVDLSKASQSNGWAKPLETLSNLELLHLSNCKIVGQVPITEFLNLTHLFSLRMGYNSLSSSIPKELANLTSLSVLDLGSSNLQGSVPYLSQVKELYVDNNPGITIDLSLMFEFTWSHLEKLDISFTQVNGSIPNSLSNTSSLIDFRAISCLIHGSIPPSFNNLSKLEKLFLDVNYITGHLSTSISNLQNLQYLSLFENSLQGPIPDSFCKISSLRYIHLADNSITGALPKCIHQLTHLNFLMLEGNEMRGTIPSLMNLIQSSSACTIGLGYSGLIVRGVEDSFPSNFQPVVLDLGSCSMDGGIPNFLSNLTQVKILMLAQNNLSGTIPSWLFSLPNLGYLDLSLNNLEGIVPSTIRLQQSYFPTTLCLANNKLKGPIPLLAETIEVIDLSGNKFKGHIPSQFGGLQRLRYLSLSGNDLYGPIPVSFCHKNNVLMHIDLSNNSLSGTIPRGLGNCSSLVSLNLAWNNLRGMIPNELMAAKNMSFLQLNGNAFAGPFPNFIQELQKLEVLNLGNNKFEGEIPHFIGDLQMLRVLVLELNSFNGSIPMETNNLKNLQFLGFSNNNLNGFIPDKLQCLSMLTRRPKRNIIGQIISYQYSGVDLNIAVKGQEYKLEAIYTDTSGIDLSCNMLTGKIPPELGLLEGLYMLNLSHNNLDGEIPTSMGNMSDLESLDLSSNCLSGNIPLSLTSLNFLSWLNLSYNNLSGVIPKGMHFDTLYNDGLAYIGNKFLCGSPDGPNCTQNGSRLIPETADEVDAVEENLYFYGLVMIGFVVGLGGYLITIMYLMNQNWRQGYWDFIDRIVLRIVKLALEN